MVMNAILSTEALISSVTALVSVQSQYRKIHMWRLIHLISDNLKEKKKQLVSIFCITKTVSEVLYPDQH